MSEWTKVDEEHMPEHEQVVFVTVHYKDWGKPMDTDGLVLPPVKYDADKKRWLGFTGDEWEQIWYKWIVTHWMPYPAPAQD